MGVVVEGDAEVGGGGDAEGHGSEGRGSVGAGGYGGGGRNPVGLVHSHFPQSNSLIVGGLQEKINYYLVFDEFICHSFG